MARGAPARVLQDTTPLSGPRIDVAVRIGWVARMARLCAPGGWTLDALAAAVGSNRTRLNRVETGTLRDGALLDGYERALGLPPASLRAPVDVICRGFPWAPADVDPGSRHLDVRAVSRLTDRVGAPAPSGGDWLAWARALSPPTAVGLPESTARDLVTRLVAELARATGHAYPSRYEALSLLRCSGYGHVVLEVAQQVVADPDVQVLYDLLSGVGEQPTREAAQWCLDLLDDPRDRVVVAGALGLENMAQVSGRPLFWADLVDPLRRRADSAEPGSSRREWLSHLLRLVPPEVQQRATVAVREPLEPTTAIPPGRADSGEEWRDARRRSQQVTDALGLPEQPVLSRLLWEVVHSPHESRAVTAYLLLGAVPAVARPVADQLAALVEASDDPVVRARGGRRLSGMSQQHLPAPVRAWVHDPDPELRRHAVRILGCSAEGVDRAVLRELVDGDAASRTAALYAAGMTGDPLLAELVATGHPAAGGAAWWLHTGPRLTEA